MLDGFVKTCCRNILNMSNDKHVYTSIRLYFQKRKYCFVVDMMNIKKQKNKKINHGNNQRKSTKNKKPFFSPASNCTSLLPVATISIHYIRCLFVAGTLICFFSSLFFWCFTVSCTQMSLLKHFLPSKKTNLQDVKKLKPASC